MLCRFLVSAIMLGVMGLGCSPKVPVADAGPDQSVQSGTTVTLEGHASGGQGSTLSYLWTPHDAYDIDMALKLRPPGGGYWLGTDPFGRDVASLLLVGARASIAVGLIAVGIGLVIGTALGLLASAKRGWLSVARPA